MRCVDSSNTTVPGIVINASRRRSLSLSLLGKKPTPGPKVPTSIIDKITGRDPNAKPLYFWQFLQVCEDLKKTFSSRYVEFVDSENLIKACEHIARDYGIVYTPETDDKSFTISIEDIEGVMRPIVQEIARTIGALKMAFEAKHKTKGVAKKIVSKCRKDAGFHTDDLPPQLPSNEHVH